MDDEIKEKLFLQIYELKGRINSELSTYPCFDKTTEIKTTIIILCGIIFEEDNIIKNNIIGDVSKIISPSNKYNEDDFNEDIPQDDFNKRNKWNIKSSEYIQNIRHQLEQFCDALLKALKYNEYKPMKKETPDKLNWNFNIFSNWNFEFIKNIKIQLTNNWKLHLCITFGSVLVNIYFLFKYILH